MTTVITKDSRPCDSRMRAVGHADYSHPLWPWLLGTLFHGTPQTMSFSLGITPRFHERKECTAAKQYHWAHVETMLIIQASRRPKRPSAATKRRVNPSYVIVHKAQF
ncbi:unnamed protein product [Ectocarpus sp. 4 AP-2014]